MIILFIIVIILSYLYTSIEFFNNKITCNNKINYRLSDMFKNYKRNVPMGYEYHKKNYPNSIIVEYMDKTTQGHQYDIMEDIINKRHKLSNYKYIKKYKKYIIMHIRIGDVIQHNECNAYDLLYNNTNNCSYKYRNYVKSIQYYDNIIKQIKTNYKNYKVLFIGGIHHKINHSKSYNYINLIKKHFEKNYIKVKLRINRDADIDFLIMSKCKIFIPSGGGFSNVIQTLVTRNGGIILTNNIK